jgi:hypothetical protein
MLRKANIIEILSEQPGERKTIKVIPCYSLFPYPVFLYSSILRWVLEFETMVEYTERTIKNVTRIETT